MGIDISSNISLGYETDGTGGVRYDGAETLDNCSSGMLDKCCRIFSVDIDGKSSAHGGVMSARLALGTSDRSKLKRLRTESRKFSICAAGLGLWESIPESVEGGANLLGEQFGNLVLISLVCVLIDPHGSIVTTMC